MLIDVPRDLFDRLRTRARKDGVTEVDVIRIALDSLEWHEREVAAIQKGIDDCDAGRVRDVAEVDAELRKKHGIPINFDERDQP